jgi:hypothetical protein
MKNIKLSIITNEYQTIKEFRERCVKNIEESTRTYLIFFGFVITALALVKEFSDFETPKFLIIFPLTVCVIVGWYVYKLIIQTHINFINYTRKLNITRKFLKEKTKNSKYILLPTSGKEPAFDTIGYTGKKFSEDGVLRIIQILNSLVVGAITFLLIDTLLLMVINEFIIKIIIPFLLIIISFLMHKNTNCILIKEAEEKWEKETK